MERRAFLSGLAAVVAAPAVIRTPGLLMPVRGFVVTPVLQLHDAARTILGGGALVRSIEAWRNAPHRGHQYIIATPEQSAALAAHRAAGLPMWVDRA